MSDNFREDEPYGVLLRMAREEATFWSFLKTCYKQKREDIKAQNVNMRMIEIIGTYDVDGCSR